MILREYTIISPLAHPDMVLLSSHLFFLSLSDSLTLLPLLNCSLTLTFLSSLYHGLCDGVVVWVSSFGEFRCGSMLVLVVFER